MSTCEPLHVPPGTPNVRWSARWVVLIHSRPQEDGSRPDAELHYRQHTDEYGLTSARCGLSGRALDLTGTWEKGHPVVACPRCLSFLPARSRRRHAL